MICNVTEQRWILRKYDFLVLESKNDQALLQTGNRIEIRLSSETRLDHSH